MWKILLSANRSSGQSFNIDGGNGSAPTQLAAAFNTFITTNSGSNISHNVPRGHKFSIEYLPVHPS